MTHKFAKFLIFATSALGLSALPALATTCTADEGVSITAGFTCSLGGLTFDFTNVAFTPSNGEPAPVVELDNITGITGDDYTLGFSVSVGGETTPPAAEDLDLNYTVTGGSFTQVDNSFLSDGSGDQSLNEDVYTDPSRSTLLAVMDNTAGTEEYSSTFGPVSGVYIQKDFNGLTSEFTDSIVSTPEPSSLGLLLFGAFGIVVATHRKFRRA